MGDMQKMLEILLECQDGKLNTEEACRKHGIKIHNYYKWRKKLIRAGLELLKTQFGHHDDQAILRQKNIELAHKVKKLEQNKALWELRYKWLRWQLESHHQPEVRKLADHVKVHFSSEGTG